MKALVRNEFETITEDKNLPGIDWQTGMPLTNPDWAGGPYTLIENFVPPAEVPKNNVTDSNTERVAKIAELKAQLAALEDGL